MFSFFKLTFFISLIITIGIISFFFSKYPFYPQDLFLKDRFPSVVNTVVILEGSPNDERINYGIRLANDYEVSTIFYPGISQSKEKIIKEYIKKNKLDIKVEIQKEAGSTMEEAFRTKAFCKKYNINNLFLVTSPYHSYRAKWIFEKIVKGVDIVSAPVPKDESIFNFEFIENNSYSAKLFHKEQLKFTFYWFMYFWR